MVVRKLSVALDDDVAAAAATSAERRGLSLSAWLNDAAARALAIEDGLAAVAEWEVEHGPLTKDELAAAEAVLDAARKSRTRRSA
jgi:dihydroxyacetone kinase